jgi:Ras-related protein Rab-2A
MNYDYSFKIATIGCTHVGKTAIVNRFCDDKYKSVWEATIGVDFSSAFLKVDSKQIKFQIWDTAGQENFAPIIRSYYRGVAGVIMVFDLGDRSSFHKLSFWLNELNQNKEENHPMPIILVGHKADKKIRQISEQEALDFADEHKMEYIEASAKLDSNIRPIFTKLAKNILDNLKVGYDTGVRFNPLQQEKTNLVLSSDKRGGDSFLACCCLC